MADFKDLLKQLVDKYPGATNEDFQKMLEGKPHISSKIGDVRTPMSPEDSNEFSKLLTRDYISKMDMDNPKHAQHVFNNWKGSQADIRDLKNKLPLSENFADQMSDTLIRQKPTGQTARALEEMGNRGEAFLDHLKDAGYNMERKRGYMQKMSDGVPFEKLMKMVKPGAKTLLSALPLAAAGLGAYGVGQKAMAGDIPGAALEAGSMVDPTGLSSAASQVKERLQHPEMAKENAKEDFLRALPVGLDLEESAIQQNTETEDPRFAKIKAMFGK